MSGVKAKLYCSGKKGRVSVANTTLRADKNVSITITIEGGPEGLTVEIWRDISGETDKSVAKNLPNGGSFLSRSSNDELYVAWPKLNGDDEDATFAVSFAY